MILEGANHAGYRDLDADGHWGISSGRFFFHPDLRVTPDLELQSARSHFFLPQRLTDALNHSSTIAYDRHKLLLTQSKDAIGNVVQAVNNYRVLKPELITDLNGNRSGLAYDALGLVVGTALMGKETETIGDNLIGFEPDLNTSEIENFFDSPTEESAALLLGNATSRIIFDRDQHWRIADREKPLPTYSAFLARETHTSDPIPEGGLRVRINFSYSDGFGRVIRSKSQADSNPPGDTTNKVDPRWLGTGWTIFNNKGNAVRKYEPFFDDTHEYKAGRMVGVSSTRFYDPLGRVIGVLHPNHSWQKTVFQARQTISYDEGDTVLVAEPSDDTDVGAFFSPLPRLEYSPTWYEIRRTGCLGPEEQKAAIKAASHANTPSVSHYDPLGRPFLSVTDNGPRGRYCTRSYFDILGNIRSVVDAKGRFIMKYDYDMLGNRIHLASMDSGERWMLDNAVGKLIISWDSRDQRFQCRFDALMRPTQTLLREGDCPELLVGQITYGEAEPHASASNLRGKAFRVFD
jgi:hypothetical protein